MGAVQSRRTRRIRAIIAAMREARAQPCRRCGQEIDYDAPPGGPDAFNAGHVKSWATHPELREDPANFQPEHEVCNKSAGNRDPRPGLGLMSRRW
ncbi:MAG: HNH endonuclease [Nocardioides sp.]